MNIYHISVLETNNHEWVVDEKIDEHNNTILTVRHAEKRYKAAAKLFFSNQFLSRCVHLQRDLFEKELYWFRVLNHPNIVNYLDSGCSHGKYFIVMELGGSDLNDVYWRVTRAEKARKLRRYLSHIVDGLIYMHAQEVAHGDIKPENILVCENDTAKITDFGTCKYFKPGTVDEFTRCGTFPFMAAEVFLRLPHCPAAADVWSLGATLMSLFCECRWEHPHPSDPVFHAVFNNRTHNLHPWCEMPQDLRFLVDGMLKIKPSERLTLQQIKKSEFLTTPLGQ